MEMENDTFILYHGFANHCKREIQELGGRRVNGKWIFPTEEALRGAINVCNKHVNSYYLNTFFIPKESSDVFYLGQTVELEGVKKRIVKIKKECDGTTYTFD